MDDRMTAIRTEFREAEPEEILHQSPRALLGVTPEAESALRDLDITSVFDLATSAVFAAAGTLVEGAADLRSAVARHGVPTSDIVRETVTAGKTTAELPFLPIRALRGVPVSKAAAIAAALDTPTVRDLANYPPFRAAHALLQSLYFPESDRLFDPERPPDLVPSTGEYPTERVQYQTLLMDAPANGVAGLVSITSHDFVPLDLGALADGAPGFKSVAFGALLTYTQSWFSQGVTLGQLLHSVALAPGESTRIAVVDWTRRSRAGETDVISEEDELSNEAAHNRAISEVTNAVATEAQSGFSHSSTFATSTEVGASHAVDVSGPLGGLLGGVGASSAQSFSNATSMGTADSYSSSFGQRTVGSSMGQNIADRTHQNAHSSRTRRASVVKEVAQSEHENVSTRVLANYNHMHALTVQYYEVVQVHRVDLTLAKAERVVFIPVKLMDFTNEQLIRRFRGVLIGAALTSEIREALSNLDVIELRPDAKQQFSALGDNVTEFIEHTLTGGAATTGRSLEAMVSDAVARAVAAGEAATHEEDRRDSPLMGASPDDESRSGAERKNPIKGERVRAPMLRTATENAKAALWDELQATRMSKLLGQAVIRADSTSLYLPTDVSIERAFVDAGGTVVRPVFTFQSGATDTTVSATDPIALSDVTKIDLRGASPEGDVEAKLVLTLNRNGVRFPLELPAVTIPQGRRTDTPLVTVRAGAVDVNLSRHLEANRLYYSTAALRSLDAAQLALLLSGLSIELETDGDGAGPATQIIPIAQVIDPVPIRYVGNYLAFRMSVDTAYDLKWKKWLDDHAVVVGKLYNQDIVPLGTGGVFAEAVLGRSNAAEKLDITRFWDWQDSPIPLQPTEIAAIQTGSRATPEDTRPGQLSTPIVNITSPTGLPDPVGTAAILQAIQNGSMFRDMSGLQGTIGLLQAGIAQTMAGATAAGQQAGENMNNLLKATTERQRIGAEMVTDLAKTAASVYTGGAIPAGGGMSGGARGGGGGGASQQGAKINYFDKTAKEAPAPGGAKAGSQPATGVPQLGAGSPASGQSGGGQPSLPPTTTYSQNPAALDSVWGDTKAPADVATTLLNSGGPVISGHEPTNGGLVESARAWPILDPDAVLPRIEELRQKPALLEYGYVGLPVAGHFLHTIARAKPDEFAEFGRTLFASGLGFLGERKVSPSSAVRNIDYGELAVNYYPAAPAQADWMMQVALRDSGSWLSGSLGQDSTSVLATATKELNDFYDSTGWYVDATFFDDRSHPDTQNYPVKADGSNHVFLWTRMDAQGLWRTPVRLMFLTAKPAFDAANDQVKLSHWAAGDENFTEEISISRFKDIYLGMTVATLDI
jgi:hypothetical protein